MFPTDRLMTPREFRSSITDFLQQFVTLGSRWVGEYEPITEFIIGQAAKFQLAWLQRANLAPADLLDESTMIASALYCLLLTNELNQVTNVFTDESYLKKDSCHAHLADVEKNDRCIRPAVDVWRFRKDAHTSEKPQPHGHSLASILRVVIQTAQSILYRRNPEDEPYIFHILSILLLVLQNVEFCGQWNETIDEAEEALRDCLHNLCHMFHLSTNNFHPLNEDFDIETYSSMVDANFLAVEHYRVLHQIWMDNSKYTSQFYAQSSFHGPISFSCN